MSVAPGIWTVRDGALPLARRVRGGMGGVIYPRARDRGLGNRELFRAEFGRRREWVLIMSCGIAARYLDGLARDKRLDPAVVVLDAAGRHAISFLSGHEGGANALAYRVARCVGAVPVVTTASEALKPLVLGIGCRRGVGADRIGDAVGRLLEGAGRVLADVREVATIDLKADEVGLLEWVERVGIPLRIFRARDVAARAWVSAPSERVRRVTGGAVGVCEPCALMASARGGLIVGKTNLCGVSLALAEDDAGVAG